MDRKFNFYFYLEEQTSARLGISNVSALPLVTLLIVRVTPKSSAPAFILAIIVS